MPRCSRRLSAALLALAAILAATATPLHAAFNFVRIADTSASRPSLFTPVAINQGGRVAFVATDFGGSETLYTGRGGPLTKIADTAGPLASFGAPDINRHGVVAFQAYLDENTGSIGTLEAVATGVFTGDGQSLKTVALWNEQRFFFYDAAINDNGQVTSIVTTDTGASAVATRFPDRIIASMTSPAGAFGVPAINNSGVVAFDIMPSEGPQRIATGSGGPLTTRVTTKGTQFEFFDSSAQINDLGVIAFSALLKSGESGVFTQGPGGLRKIADSTGPFQSFGQPAINNHGRTSFLALLDAGQCGIFTGPNPATNRVIAEGDPLDGSTVEALFTTGRSLNDAGQVAFYAQLTDGRLGIYRADPLSTLAAIPEPSTAAIAIVLNATLLLSRPRAIVASSSHCQWNTKLSKDGVDTLR